MLSAIETRVLATLAEKQRTVPDVYPMTLNALLAGCNQKTSRNPVMELSKHEALTALEHLKALELVTEDCGSRVLRFSHRLEKVLQVPVQSSVLLTVLMLRGPQTAGELRLNCERMYSFADISSVETFLAELAARSEGALVIELARSPGARENRWAQLLGGHSEARASASDTPAAATYQEIGGIESRIAALEADVAGLKAIVARLEKQGSAPSS